MADWKLNPVLLLDTCGERASLALSRGDEVLAERTLAERAASVDLLPALRELLRDAGIALRELGGIGVVNGPGSFTGVRVGLATAKGLCAAAELPIAAVSRLEVLANAGQEQEGVAVLSAGRGQVYVREAGREWLTDAARLPALAQERVVVYAEAALEALLAGVRATRKVELSARDALWAVQRRFAAGGSELGLVDANYVRNEEEIYARKRERAEELVS